MRIPLILLLLTACTTSCERRVQYDHHPSLITQIAAFETGLEEFKKDRSRYPTTAEGLAALVRRPADIPEARWHGPYFEKIPLDPWGHDCAYRFPGIHNTNRFDIYSCGPDGVSKSGGEDADDINNWPKRRAGQ